ISALTSDVDGEDAVAAVQWAAVPEAENYTVSTRIPGEDFETAVEGVDGTEADVSGLRVGEDYEVQVTALRGEDSATSQPYTFTVAGEVERWDTAHAGVGSGGEVIEHEDGSLECDRLDSGAKIADSEDGFWYHYTEIDPQTENFTLDATFEVDDDSRKDNQSGFGVIAVDDFVPGDTSARYFNSAGAMTAKYAFGVDGGGCPYVLCQGGRDQCLAFELVDEVMLGSPAGWCCCRLRGRWGQAAVTIGTVGALGGE